ncbi:MAG: thioredoxin domain-containing protein [Firmicutes bacterium]|nr:thioredoxin domain-containing protein [Bacillota bacterium]
MPVHHQERKPNRLIHETSPYLLQHAYNPVDWYPWGDEALERARTEDKPILLSIGYSACHWCHVMERESFENPEIAALMNQHFVNIKVDREERPDLDEIYQTAAQLLTGQGGWPLTVFLTPDQRPFFAGTYFPPEDRYGRPGFARVLKTLSEAYQQERARIDRIAAELVRAIQQVDRRDVDRRAPIRPETGEALLAKAVEWLARAFDREYGGFGDAPKFPNAPLLELFIRHAARTGQREYLEMACTALAAMARGGIYDHLGGGFHRYATDRRWLIPHFEKMLYDNALLPCVYLQAWQLTGDPLFERVVRETLAYVEREMSHPEGGFYSSQDADAEGEEGKFFVWRRDEVLELLGRELGALFCDAYGVTPRGNFEKGASVLHAAVPPEACAQRHGLSPEEAEARLAEARARLFEARERRVKPGRDEKAIAAWNALMISAFARAGRALGERAFIERARRAAAFVEARLIRGGRLVRSFKEKPSPVPGFLEDYACWAQALIDLYEATLERAYLEKAAGVVDAVLELFWDDQAPGFFLTPRGHEELVHRPKDWRDQSIPSGTGVAVQALLRLDAAFDRRGYRARAEQVLETYARQMDQNPWGTASLLLAYDGLVRGATEVVLVAGESPGELEPFQRVIGRRYLPHGVVHAIGEAEAREEGAPLLWRGKGRQDGKPTAYVCRGEACSAPVTDPAALDGLLAACVAQAAGPGER